jgi:predicted RND superfamily exporter protein
MKALLQDVFVSIGLAVLIIVVVLFTSFNSTFIYRGF